MINIAADHQMDRILRQLVIIQCMRLSQAHKVFSVTILPYNITVARNSSCKCGNILAMQKFEHVQLHSEM